MRQTIRSHKAAMNSRTEFLSDEIHRRYGSIRRARGSFLYTAKNVRLTDLYQENGRAILGWGGSSAFTIMKNVLNRGISGSYRTDFSHRLEKSVCDLFGSNKKILCFTAKKDAEEAAGRLCDGKIISYRPWESEKSDVESAGALIFEPPLPWAQELFILALNNGNEISEKWEKISAETGITRTILPPPMEAAYTRAVYNLIQELKERKEKDFFIYDREIAPYWTRKGPYLYPKKELFTEESYADFVLHCLDNTIVINPSLDGASIVPFGADRGVFSSLLKNPWKSV